jgi:hypothetical protein
LVLYLAVRANLVWASIASPAGWRSIAPEH